MAIIDFRVFYGLNESVRIDLEEINNIREDKLYVCVCDSLNRSNVVENIHLPVIKETRAIPSDKSFVSIRENFTFRRIKNHLQKSKVNGFTNILVLVDDTNVDKKSLEVFNRLIKENDIVDFNVIVRG